MKFFESARTAFSDIIWRKRPRQSAEKSSGAPELDDDVQWTDSSLGSTAKRRRYSNYSSGFSWKSPQNIFGSVLGHIGLGQLAERFVKTPEDSAPINSLLYFQPVIEPARRQMSSEASTSQTTWRQRNGSVPPLVDLTEQDDEVPVISSAPVHVNGNGISSPNRSRTSPVVYVVTDDDDDEPVSPLPGTSNHFAQRFSPMEDDDDIKILKVTNARNEECMSTERRWQRRPLKPRGSDSKASTSRDQSFLSCPSSSSPPSSGVVSPSSQSSVLQQVVNLEEKNRYRQVLEAMGGGQVRYGQRSRPARRLSSEETIKAGLLRSKSLLNQLISQNEPQLDGLHASEPSTSKLSEPPVGFGGERLDPERVAELNRKFEFDPRAFCDRIRCEYLPGSEQRRKYAEQLEKEVDLRREARQHRERSYDEELRLRLRFEGLLLPEPEELVDEFPALNDDQQAAVAAAFGPGSASEVLVEGFSPVLKITRKDIITLKGLQWLNDEIIFFYLNLLVDRGGKNMYPKVYAFNTFFYPKIMQGGHASVKRWTRKVDVFSYDLLLVPVHLGAHWCLAVIDFRKRLIAYYDSMGGTNSECLKKLGEYLKAESLDKKKVEFDSNGWEKVCMQDIPEQMNGSDCGMFALKFAEYVSRDAPITFTQEHMPYFRRRMAYEILTKTLM